MVPSLTPSVLLLHGPIVLSADVFYVFPYRARAKCVLFILADGCAWHVWSDDAF